MQFFFCVCDICKLVAWSIYHQDVETVSVMSVSVCFRAKFPVEICEWKMLPRNVFMALFCLLLFMQNLLLLHQQLVIVLVARIRLLWILEVLIQLRRPFHRRLWRMDVKEKRTFSPDKIFTASKASRRNLWSFVTLAKVLVGAKNRSHSKWLRVDRFFG